MRSLTPILASVLLLGLAPSDAPSSWKPFDLGAHHRAVSTKSAEAQRAFDQGLIWSFAFNHDEAERAFQEAALRLNPRHPGALHLTIHALEASRTRSARRTRPTGSGRSSPTRATSSTCRPTSTSVAGAGATRPPRTSGRSRPTGATPRGR